MKVRDTKQGHIWILALILVMVLSVSTVSIAQVDPSMESAKIGIRGGVGTDISGGLAYGIGGNYLIDLQSNALELYPASVNIALVFWATIAYNVNKLCLWI